MQRTQNRNNWWHVSVDTVWCKEGVYRCNRRLHPSPRVARQRSSCPLWTAGPCTLEQTDQRKDRWMFSQHWHWLWWNHDHNQTVYRACVNILTPKMMDHIEVSYLREEAADCLVVVLPVADSSCPEEQHQSSDHFWILRIKHLFINACSHQEWNESLMKDLFKPRTKRPKINICTSGRRFYLKWLAVQSSFTCFHENAVTGNQCSWHCWCHTILFELLLKLIVSERCILHQKWDEKAVWSAVWRLEYWMHVKIFSSWCEQDLRITWCK